MLDHVLHPDILEDTDYICTCCMEPISHLKVGRVQRHPLLGVPICRKCKNFYFSGEWTKDEDGTYDHCRWCANGGELLLCDNCPNTFCKKCIKRNLGRKKVTDIEVCTNFNLNLSYDRGFVYSAQDSFFPQSFKILLFPTYFFPCVLSGKKCIQ